jgi:hypothetical protein
VSGDPGIAPRLLQWFDDLALSLDQLGRRQHV